MDGVCLRMHVLSKWQVLSTSRLQIAAQRVSELSVDLTGGISPLSSEYCSELSLVWTGVVLSAEVDFFCCC